ncbi:hypothetical protein KCU90_g138, partial [Aureobasidium melanogenum]
MSTSVCVAVVSSLATRPNIPYVPFLLAELTSPFAFLIRSNNFIHHALKMHAPSYQFFTQLGSSRCNEHYMR